MEAAREPMAAPRWSAAKKALVGGLLAAAAAAAAALAYALFRRRSPAPPLPLPAALEEDDPTPLPCSDPLPNPPPPPPEPREAAPLHLPPPPLPPALPPTLPPTLPPALPLAPPPALPPALPPAQPPALLPAPNPVPLPLPAPAPVLFLAPNPLRELGGANEPNEEAPSEEEPSRGDVRNAAEEEDIPEEFLCPISKEAMVDPYTSPEGHSYDWNQIVKWLMRNPVSPFTSAPLTVADLVPNRNLHSAIVRYMTRKGIRWPPEEYRKLSVPVTRRNRNPILNANLNLIPNPNPIPNRNPNPNLNPNPNINANDNANANANVRRRDVARVGVDEANGHVRIRRVRNLIPERNLVPEPFIESLRVFAESARRLNLSLARVFDDKYVFVMFAFLECAAAFIFFDLEITIGVVPVAVAILSWLLLSRFVNRGVHLPLTLALSLFVSFAWTIGRVAARGAPRTAHDWFESLVILFCANAFFEGVLMLLVSLMTYGDRPAALRQ